MPQFPAPRAQGRSRRSTPVRRWCAGLAAAACIAFSAVAATAAPATVAPSRLQDLQTVADGVLLLPGRFERGRQPDGNSLLLLGREGWVLVDSGRHAEHTEALRQAMRASGRPLRAVINTHWHLDHLGGNALLRDTETGWRSLASAALRDAVNQRMPQSEADLKRLLQDPATDDTTRRMVEVDLALYARRSLLLPDELLDVPPRDVQIAGRALRVGVELGVSGGDVWVLDQASGVLAVGDFVTLPVPFLDTACTAQWRASLQRLQALPFSRVLPGHGPLLDREGFNRYGRALDRLLTCAAGEGAVTECAAGWIADLGPLLPAASQRSVSPMLAHYFEQRLRVPPAERERFCSPR